MILKKAYFVLLFILLMSTVLFSQKVNDSIVVLDEVVLTDAKLIRFSNGVKIRVLSDSILKTSNSSLTDLLRFNSTIYLKENGYGMVSSPSFRGTSAQQTAVVWNGININSQLNGQTDFNTIIPENYSNVAIRSGGGSVQYGSGAIGGSIHLNDELSFKKNASQSVLLSYGSFNSKKASFNTTAGDEKWTYNFGINYMDSDNDYKYLGTDKLNENGEFNSVNINASFGYFISEHHLLKFYHNTFIGDRNFSSTLTAPSNSNYEDVTKRSLIEWNHFSAKSAGKFKLAYLSEEYKYFANKDTERFTFGNSKNILANYDYKLYLNKVTLNGIVEYSNITGEGTSIENIERNFFSTTVLMSHNVNDKLNYGISIRQEFVNDYDSPFIISVDGKYQFSSMYSATLNASKNYRVPTFNDLYWTGAGASGNKDLVPESSLQLDLGNIFTYKNAEIKLNGYYLNVDNLIQWRPNGTVWTPVNVAKTENYGAELEVALNNSFGKHNFNLNGGFAYTIAENKETKKQLLYVPKEKVTIGLSYDYNNWGAFYQMLYNGKAYSTTDNTDYVNGYAISNSGLKRSLDFDNKVNLDILIKINNLFNKNYQNTAYRPMPNRNFQLQIITKF